MRRGLHSSRYAGRQYRVMRTSRIGIHILPEDFDEFKRMLPGENRFARTYAHWLEESIKGVPPRRLVTVHPGELSLYCLQTGQPPSIHALQALAVKKAKDEDEARTQA
jgi:hypothetical protein